MKYLTTLTSLSLAVILSVSTVGQVAFAEASDAVKVDATELTSELRLHPLLGQYSLSVVANDDDTLSVEGMIDDQKAYDALEQFLDDKTDENSDWDITNNVVNS